MMKWKLLILAGAMALLSGCSSEAKLAETRTITGTETRAESVSDTAQTEEGTSQQEEWTLASVAKLLGMKDSETKTMLGGGEENWTADRSFYIGRIFQAEVYGEIYPVYTTCGEDGVVESVSMQMVSGGRKVTKEEVERWVERISEHTGVAPSEEGGPSEGGSKHRSWRKDGKIATLRYMEDNLSISFQKQIGELVNAVPEKVLTEESGEETSIVRKLET